jgi:hypothetical protein
MCIRQEEGYCCIQYTQCTDTNPFSLDQKSTTADTTDIGTYCTNDYIEIPGGSTTCNQQGVGGFIMNRYCGRRFSVASKAAISVAICGKFCN